MAEKRKFFKDREYLNDFKLNDKGEYEYTGLLHALDETKVTLKEVRVRLAMTSFIILALYIVCGLIKAEGVMNSSYVTIPYVFGFFFICVLFYKVILFCIERNYPIRDYDYKSTIEKYSTYSMLVIILDIATIIGELIYIILNGINEYIPGTIIFIISIILIALLAINFRQYFLKLKWKEIGSKGKDLQKN